jgi:two-component sensor histidine kinase
MASGIHLYLLTSPLIVLTAFDTKNVKLLSLAMSSYLFNYIIISIADKYMASPSAKLSSETLNLFYFINFSFALFLLMVLSFYFFYNNNRTNGLLIIRNEELRKRQAEIALENRIRKEAEIKATQALTEKEVLLSEIHHRVKNNLAVISGLLEIHTINVQNIGILKVIRQCQNRIKSMAILHEKLYENNSVKDINVKEYIQELLDFIKGTYCITGKEVAFEIYIDEITMEMSKAMPFGLLMNELISNSYKHAFKHHTGGLIFIGLTKNENGFELIYRDNGTGFTYTNDPNRASLGLTLIETFSQQLHGKYSFAPQGEGMLFKIKFN